MAGRANALCLFLSRGDDLQQHIYRVSEVNQHIKQLIDADPGLNALLVRGEISNYKIYPSGHHYFTLKDGESALRCVMFAGMAKYLRFRPQNGMKVVASGKISVYPRDGVISFTAPDWSPTAWVTCTSPSSSLRSACMPRVFLIPSIKSPFRLTHGASAWSPVPQERPFMI